MCGLVPCREAEQCVVVPCVVMGWGEVEKCGGLNWLGLL